jgi:hypothetical protein
MHVQDSMHVQVAYDSMHVQVAYIVVYRYTHILSYMCFTLWRRV